MNNIQPKRQRHSLSNLLITKSNQLQLQLERERERLDQLGAARLQLKMSEERIHSGCVAVLSFTSFSNRTHSISDYAGCGTPVWKGKSLSCVCFKIKRKGSEARICLRLTALQEERLKRLRHRIKLQFDASRLQHQEALRALWSATYPGEELQSLISDQWKEMGWQGKDPSTDFRGAGFICLENLLFFAKTFSLSFQSLLRKQTGKRAMWEYPFAVAGVNITFMILQLLDLDATKPQSFIRAVFLQMLSENEWAFDLLYCVAFMIMDKLWLEKHATYMEFNDILRLTRSQVEKELEFLMDDVMLIEDMPSYSLLRSSHRTSNLSRERGNSLSS